MNLSNTRVADLTKIPSGFSDVDLSNTDVSDLSPLENWSELKSLKIAGSRVTDLSVLPEMPFVRELDLSRTSITDLSGIERFARLERLDLSGTPVHDLAPLSKLLELVTLDLSDTRVSDLSAIGKLRSIYSLNIDNTNVKDLSAISSLTRLSELSAAGTQISDIRPVAELSASHAYDSGVRDLNISRTGLVDLKPISKFFVFHKLNMTGTQIDSLVDLPRKTTTLIALDCPSLRIRGSDLIGLSSLSRAHIDCSGLHDLSALVKLQNLTHLTLQNIRPNHDLHWLREMKRLRKLAIVGTPVQLSKWIDDIRRAPRLAVLTIPTRSRIDESVRSQAPLLKILRESPSDGG